jgi:hypothetical protein
VYANTPRNVNAIILERDELWSFAENVQNTQLFLLALKRDKIEIVCE